MNRAAIIFALVVSVLPLSPSWSAEAAEPKLTPQAFYESFNIRSIYSAIWNGLRDYCGSFPKDFFTVAKSSDTYLELAKRGHSEWFIEFHPDNVIVLTEDLHGGSYRVTAQYELAFSATHRDWRAIAGETLFSADSDLEDVQALGEFLEHPENCIPYPREDNF